MYLLTYYVSYVLFHINIVYLIMIEELQYLLDDLVNEESKVDEEGSLIGHQNL